MEFLATGLEIVKQIQVEFSYPHIVHRFEYFSAIGLQQKKSGCTLHGSPRGRRDETGRVDPDNERERTMFEQLFKQFENWLREQVREIVSEQIERLREDDLGYGLDDRIDSRLDDRVFLDHDDVRDIAGDVFNDKIADVTIEIH